MSYKTHVFICTNSPDKPGKCGHKNAESMRRNLKERCKNESWGKDLRVNASGCLGHCERGIAAVIYPKSKWLLDLQTTDEDRLFEEIKSAALQSVSETDK